MTATRAVVALDRLSIKGQNPAVLFDALLRESKDPKYFKNFQNTKYQKFVKQLKQKKIGGHISYNFRKAPSAGNTSMILVQERRPKTESSQYRPLSTQNFGRLRHE